MLRRRASPSEVSYWLQVHRSQTWKSSVKPTANSSMPESKGCMIGTNIADFGTSDVEAAAALRGHLRGLEDAYSTKLL